MKEEGRGGCYLGSMTNSVSKAFDYRVGCYKFEFPRNRPIPRVLKQLRNKGSAFTLQTARPSHGLDDHVKW